MKRFFVLVLSILLVLTACGGGEVEDTSVPTVGTAPSQPTEGTTQPTEETARPAEPEAAKVKRELICEGKTYADFYDLMEALWEEARFEQEEHSLTIEGLSTPVTLFLNYDCLTAYSAWGYTFEVDPEDQHHAGMFGMDDSGDLVEYQGIPILSGHANGGDYTVILFEEGPWIRSTEDDRSLVIYVDREDRLMAREYSTKFDPSIDHWDTAPIDLAVSRDEFYDAVGPCVIEGTDVQLMLTEVRTISDVADLDQIFADAKADGRYPQFHTVDQLLEWNRADRHPEGDSWEEGFWSREEHREDGTLRSRTTCFRDQITCVQLYDEQGRLTVQGDYDSFGRTRDRYYSYDGDGNCTDWGWSVWDEEVVRYTMTYDGQGRLLRRVRTRSGVTTGVQDFTYAGDGGWTETFSQNGQEKYACRYDAEGKLIRHWTYEDGVAVETEDVSTLVKAQQVLEVWIPALDNSPITYSFRYDGQDLIYSSASYGTREETSYDGSVHRPLDSVIWPEHEEVQMKNIYTYADGIMTGKKIYEEGELIASHVYTWQGDAQTEQWLLPDGTVDRVIVRNYEDGRLMSCEEEGFREVYEYSEDGRSVKCTTFVDGVPDAVRTYLYDEAGRRIGDWGPEYIYDEGMLETVQICSEDHYTGNVMIDWYEVWVTPAQAKDLTDTFDLALSWLL